MLYRELPCLSVDVQRWLNQICQLEACVSELQVAFQQICLQLCRGSIYCQHWDLQSYIGQHRPWSDLHSSTNVAQEGTDLC